MFRLLLVSVLVTITLGASPAIRPRVPMLDGRIVGGKEVNIEEHPYQLSLEFFGDHFCGASIIDETRVLTAAHCTDGLSAKYMTIRANSTLRGIGGQVIQVARVCQHPKYSNYPTIDNDVSVLILESPITFGLGAQPIDLQRRGVDVEVGVQANVTGWGALSSEGASPRYLQQVSVPRVSTASCKASYGQYRITESMFCFGYPEGGKDSCQGDSGGPLVVDNVQVGVVSWGRGCAARNYPGVYARVDYLRDHIDNCV